ncbi:HSP20 family protein [Haloactinospora alba]|uniref:HSP20 family protein n=1 Tax=Haloactinospora alba TaxID=405555 RepID=A0A543N778_9ACTN|nr:HSP20 family small heat-shock protein [Haloactinospora alba]TQN27685.1 HSP20 family protein [Haloactinospora alba]
MMLRFDPFHDLSNLANEMVNATRGPRMAPMDVEREGENYVARFDLPGIDPDSVDITVENSTLTVRAERPEVAEGTQFLVSERPRGSFVRQLTLGDGLDVEKIDADYQNGVLTLRIPVAERAKPRKISVTPSDKRQELSSNVT